MKDKTIIGIYCIKNLTNRKIYVGKSINIKERIIIHFSMLRNVRHYNIFLQEDWIIFGESSFSYYILEECESENLDERERFYIKKLKSKNPKFGYNQTEGGGGITGYIHTVGKKVLTDIGFEFSNKIKKWGKEFGEERRRKLKEAQIGKKKEGSSSKYYGVKIKGKSRWEAYITDNRKQIHISYCKKEEDAAKAYDEYVISNNLNRPLNFPPLTPLTKST
jgi:group I intron endonuclease